MPAIPVIAIVDDDEEVRTAIGGLVRSVGHRPRTFASAEEFLQYAQLDEISCLISDVKMPGMSGIELYNLLVQRGKKLPAIFVTAFPEERVRRQVQAAGAIGFLPKPFDGNSMIACIDHALDAKRRQ